MLCRSFVILIIIIIILITTIIIIFNIINMERAAATVTGKQSVRSAAKDFNIERMTLKRYIDKQGSQLAGTAYTPVP